MLILAIFLRAWNHCNDILTFIISWLTTKVSTTPTICTLWKTLVFYFLSVFRWPKYGLLKTKPCVYKPRIYLWTKTMLIKDELRRNKLWDVWRIFLPNLAEKVSTHLTKINHIFVVKSSQAVCEPGCKFVSGPFQTTTDTDCSVTWLHPTLCNNALLCFTAIVTDVFLENVQMLSKCLSRFKEED